MMLRMLRRSSPNLSKAMPNYKVTWITEHLATGHAPMSYDELDAIRTQGIDAIVNLCGEYCDLHQIESDHGFDVYYFPVEDDAAPRLEEMEKALDWLDESIYLGKKVLVHCRLGIGRTGTFITSYLLRRGFGLKLAQKKLKEIGANPTSFSQWRLLRKYGKQSGKLTLREPSLEGSRLVDLSPYFFEYELLVKEVDAMFEGYHKAGRSIPHCGKDTDACCKRTLNLQLMETAYLSHHLNRKLSREERLAAIDRAMSTNQSTYMCPLSVNGACIAYSCRPVACRAYGMASYPMTGTSGIERQALYLNAAAHDEKPFSLELVNRELWEISRRLFFALNGTFLDEKSLLFPIANVVSGKFVQDYFTLLSKSN
jgi:protein-tyrosine phosphatase